MTRPFIPWLLLALALALAAVYLFPLYWMYVTSIKSASEIYANPPTFWPLAPDFSVYPSVWIRRTMQNFLWNSVVIASGVTAITVILGTGCAYVLARYRSAWIDVGLFLILMLQVLPASVMITPLYVGFNQIGLLGSPRFAVVLAAAARTTAVRGQLSRPIWLKPTNSGVIITDAGSTCSIRIMNSPISTQTLR